MRLHRFYVSQPLGEEVVIEDVSLIKQWLKVFRYTVGDFVILFNGDNVDYVYELTLTSPSSCTLLQKEKNNSTHTTRRSFIFLSVIKKDLFELVVEKAVEHGITDIVPIFSEHTEKKNLNFDRLRIIIKEATEQSGRTSLLQIHDTCTFDEAVAMIPVLGITPDCTYVATLEGENIKNLLLSRINSTEPVTPVAFFIGPEGGWSDSEEEKFISENYTRFSFGNTVLRAETAGIACALLSTLI